MNQQDTEKLIELAQQEGGDTPLLRAMLGLSGDLKKTRKKAWRDRAVGILAIFGFLLLWNGQRQNVDSITREGATRRASICAGFEAMTNSLISVSHPSTPQAKAQLETAVAKFTSDLEQRLAPIGCQLHITLPSQ